MDPGRVLVHIFLIIFPKGNIHIFFCPKMGEETNLENVRVAAFKSLGINLRPEIEERELIINEDRCAIN